MSNVKQVHIVAEMPFNFLTELPIEDQALFARLFVAPAMGLKMRWAFIRDVPNEAKGGVTAVYRFEVTGNEALSFRALDNLRDVLASQGVVTTYDVVDIEDGG